MYVERYVASNPSLLSHRRGAARLGAGKRRSQVSGAPTRTPKKKLMEGCPLLHRRGAARLGPGEMGGLRWWSASLPLAVARESESERERWPEEGREQARGRDVYTLLTCHMFL